MFLYQVSLCLIRLKTFINLFTFLTFINWPVFVINNFFLIRRLEPFLPLLAELSFFCLADLLKQ